MLPASSDAPNVAGRLVEAIPIGRYPPGGFIPG